MAGEVYVPQRLEERGVRIAIPIEESDVWQRRVETDPGLPASYGELRDLVERHFSKKGQFASPADAVPAAGEQPLTDLTCGESLYARIYGGLANPGLAAAERDSIEAVLAEAIPTNWRTQPFTHFLLRWTETDPNPANNFDPHLIDEAGGLLELAWDRLTAAFGEPLNTGTIQVDFRDLGGPEGQAEPPNGPISFDAQLWMGNQNLRAPLAAHELFHIFQYSFGFRDTWGQTLSDVDWLAEGTARWAEVFVHQRLTGARWLTKWMAQPEKNLFSDAFGGRALPFWIFFDARFRPDHMSLLTLLQKCKSQGGTRNGLDTALGLLGHGVLLADFFSQFVASSFTAEFRRMSDGNPLYPRILGPDNQEIAPRPLTQAVFLQPGVPFQSPAISLEAFAASYHAFSFPPEANGLQLFLRARSNENVTYQVISLLRGSKVAEASITSTTLDRDSVIRLTVADTVALITSSRGTATSLVISAELV